MERLKLKAMQRARRKKRIRKRLFGTSERPRLSVYRSLQNIYAQLIDDTSGRTVVEASTLCKELRDTVKYGGNRSAAEKVGAVLAEQHDEWQVCRKYFSAESLAKLTGQPVIPSPALLAG